MPQFSMVRSVAVVVALVATLPACGSTPEERGVTGGGIGAAAGAIVGAVSGGISVLTGSLLGAGAGATTGALTDKEDLDLGDPVWQDSGETDRANPQGTVADIQAKLMMQGYDPGPLDGRHGPQTEAAIRQYQRDHDLPVDGKATPSLLEHMQAG